MVTGTRILMSTTVNRPYASGPTSPGRNRHLGRTASTGATNAVSLLEITSTVVRSMAPFARTRNSTITRPAVGVLDVSSRRARGYSGARLLGIGAGARSTLTSADCADAVPASATAETTRMMNLESIGEVVGVGVLGRTS